jgi:hypothetical protein
MREYQPTDVNRRNLAAVPTTDELRLYIELQRAMRDAVLKVLDKAGNIERYTSNLNVPDNGESYFPSLFDIALVKQEGDSYHPSIDIDLKLRIGSTENPDFDPDEEVKY